MAKIYVFPSISKEKNVLSGYCSLNYVGYLVFSFLISLAVVNHWEAVLTFSSNSMTHSSFPSSCRHAFILSNKDKQQIWQAVEKLLTDSQLEARSQ